MGDRESQEQDSRNQQRGCLKTKAATSAKKSQIMPLAKGKCSIWNSGPRLAARSRVRRPMRLNGQH